jgi:hypothetical protein
MAADSNTQLDIIEWIEKIVDSCESHHHFSNTRELVYLFEKALELEGMSFEVRQFLTNRLLDKIYNKESNFIQK